MSSHMEYRTSSKCFTFFVLLISIHEIVGPPAVRQPSANHTVPDHPDNQEKPGDDLNMKYDLEYNRYLKEVVDALESDPEFRKKLETAEEVDFRNGKIAAELEYVNHHVRTKLDELKRTELGRLRELLKMEEERKKSESNPYHHGHLDHSNPHTFEVQDLQMLMNKVRMDLDAADAQRKEEFKEYEMQKEFEKEQKMKSMDDEHKKAYLHDLEENKKKAQHHDPIHHPGSKVQLEEVWEKGDHMTQKFDPKAFFYLHDLDGNGYWDEQEVNALFLKELDKIYSNAPNGNVDVREREEEMERMREHVFKETDTNRDRFISYDEFLEQTRRDEWQRDEGWESIDQKPQFTQKEYEEFERRRQAEIQRLIEQGVLQAHPPGLQPPYQYVHPGQMQGGHPNAIPQYHPVQGAGAPIHPGQYNNPPQYQHHPGAAPQYQAHPGQPQYQAHPGAPQGQYQAHPGAGQPQYQAHPGAGQPQYQAHPGAGQPQYQAHPAASQQQYQQHPNQIPQNQQYPNPQYGQHPSDSSHGQVPQAHDNQNKPPSNQMPPQGNNNNNLNNNNQNHQPSNAIPQPNGNVPQTNQVPQAAHQQPPQNHQPVNNQAPPPNGLNNIPVNTKNNEAYHGKQ